MLTRNLFRVARKKILQFAGLAIIIALSSFAYAVLYYATQGIDEPTSRFLDECRIEQFAIEETSYLSAEEMTYLAESSQTVPEGVYTLLQLKAADPESFELLLQRRQDAFTTQFPGYELETRFFKTHVFTLDGVENRALILKDAESINLSYIDKGIAPAALDELAITEKYALAHGLSLGDSIDLGGSVYRITGFVLFPDYTFPTIDKSFIVDILKQTLVLMTDEAYESFPATESFRFVGRSLTVFDKEGFQSSVIDSYRDLPGMETITQVLVSDTTMRSGAIYEEMMQGDVLAATLSSLLAVIAMVFVTMIILKIVEAERRQTGMLKAIGYRRSEILWPYFLIIQALALPSLLIGYVLGFVFANPLKDIYLDYYLIPDVVITHSMECLLIAIALPLTVFTVLSLIAVNASLSRKAVDLLEHVTVQKTSGLSRLVARLTGKWKVKASFTIQYALQNGGKFLLFFAGIVFSTILVFFSFTFTDIIDRTTTGYFDNVDYEYEAYFDPFVATPVMEEGQEKILRITDAEVDGENVTVIGLSPDQTLYALIDHEGSDISDRLEEGMIVSSFLSVKQNLEIGDSVTLKVRGEDQVYTLAGITDEYMSPKVYLPIGEASRLLTEGVSETLYNGIYSLTLPEGAYSLVMSKTGLMEQGESMKQFMEEMVLILIMSASLVAFLIISLLSMMTLEENLYAISLLRVIGYRRREVQSMVLNSYLLYLVISYAVSVPIAIAGLKALMAFFATDYDLVLPMNINVLQVLLGLVLTWGIYFLATLFTRQKVAHISLQEALKVFSE